MSHVAEGELHAWLDGALEQLGEGRAEQVREHLRRCDACQLRLAAEEALRAQAIEVLALATPRTSELPPLESLMERARSAPATVVSVRPNRMSRAARLGWAASVVLALGAGWMARELGLHGPIEPPGLGPAAEAPAPAVPGTSSPPAEPSDVAVAPAEESAGETAAGPRDVAVQPTQVRRGLTDVAPAVADQGAGLDRVAAEPAESTTKIESSATANLVATAPPPEVTIAPLARATGAAGSGAAPAAPPPAATTATAELANSVAQRVAPSEPSAVQGSVAGERAANERARPAPGRQERAASSAVPEPGAIGIQRARTESARSDVPNLFVEGGARGANDRQARTRAPVVTSEADTSEAKGLFVPGLEVVRIQWTEVVPGQRGLRVVQRLQSGDTLEIRFVRSGGAAADAANDPVTAILNAEPLEGWSEVVLPLRDGWIIARAPLPEPELRQLLNGVGEGRR